MSDTLLNPEPLLKVENLKTYFHTSGGRKGAVAKVVDDVSFSLRRGETLAIVGESGSGKTMLARSIMGLIPEPPGIRAGGKIVFNGQDLRGLKEKQLAALRGKELAMVFQDPMTSLNPVLTIGEQIAEVIIRHMGKSKRNARADAEHLLTLVGIPSPAQRLNEYPHQLSGGLRQRVMIAIAVACKPQLLIADEPTTALDVSIQAQILRLLKRYQREHNMAMIFVSHDLGTVAGIADYIAVMYAGKIVEIGVAADIINRPRMRYTQALLESIPRLDTKSHGRLKVIEGRPPVLDDLPTGCRFAARCDYASDRCRAELPPLAQDKSENIMHRFACWHPSESDENMNTNATGKQAQSTKQYGLAP